MGEVLHAIRVFFETLASVKFTALGLAICVPRAEDDVHEPRVAEHDRRRVSRGGGAAGARSTPHTSPASGVNAIIPARAGDAVRLYLAHRAVPASTYTTLVATLLVLSIFDTAMALMIFAYALTLGVLPGIGSLGSLPGFDFGFFVANPEFSAVLLIVLVIFGTIGFFWARIHIDEFKQRVGQGFAVLRDRTEYLQHVAVWQAGDWFLRFVAIWFFLDAFGIHQSIRNVLLVQVTQSLATLVPSPPAASAPSRRSSSTSSGDRCRPRSCSRSRSGMKLTLIVTNVVLGFTALFLMLGHTDWRSISGKRPASEP